MNKISIRAQPDHRTVYLRFPGYVFEPGVVRETISLIDVVPDYKGPMINIDFDENGKAIGLEVLILGED
jgi:hypothetical protein